jgi:general secretion pathway protein F
MEVSPDQVQQARFWRKYLRLTRAGVPVLRAFQIVEEESEDETWKEVAQELRRGIERGTSISEAMAGAAHPFSLSVLEMIRTAERRGAWDEILEELIDGLLDGTFE